MIVFGDEPCSLFDSAEAGDFGAGRFLDVGVITLAGSERHELMYDEFGEGYTLPRNALDIWDGMGSPMTISATGMGRMGAFETEVVSPQNLEMVAVLGGGLNRGGTTFSWAAGNGQAIVVRLRVNNKNIACISEDDGSIDIPAAALA
jgi:hypothetical protein